MAFIDDLYNFVNNINIPEDVLNKHSEKIKENYNFGFDNIEKLINKNILDVSPETIKFLENYNFDMVKGIQGDLADKLRSTLKRGLIEGRPYTQIVSELKKVFNTTLNRLESLVRTEANRALSVGEYVAAKKSPIKLRKYYVTVEDKRTSKLCQRLARKYTKDNSIPIDKRFKDNITGESWLYPPVHPNCRSRVVYTPEDKN